MHQIPARAKLETVEIGEDNENLRRYRKGAVAGPS